MPPDPLGVHINRNRTGCVPAPNCAVPSSTSSRPACAQAARSITGAIISTSITKIRRIAPPLVTSPPQLNLNTGRSDSRTLRYG